MEQLVCIIKSSHPLIALAVTVSSGMERMVAVT